MIVFQANPDWVSRVSAGLKDLADFERWLSGGPARFDLGEHRFAAIEFSEGDTSEG